MAPKQRQVRIEQRGGQAAIQALEHRSDEELELETKQRAAALAILGARAAEKYDAKKARAYFQRAIAAARPQERIQIRRMADASLALAERRAGDLRDAVEKLGGEPPTGRQLAALRFTGLVAPPPGSSPLLRVRGVLLLLVVLAVLVGFGLGVIELIWIAFGGIPIGQGIVLGVILDAIVLAILFVIGRRKQARAKAQRAAGAA